MSGLPLRALEPLIRGSADVDAVWWGRTALWDAVMHRHHDIARRLAEAGADPWRPLIAGWSPGRLASAGPEPALFGAPPSDARLTRAEQAEIVRAHDLIATTGEIPDDDASIAFISRVDPAEATGRLRAAPIEIPDPADWAVDPWSQGMTDHEVEHTIGISDVPGGCVLTQWHGATACAPGLLSVLTRGTLGYAIQSTKHSGSQGTLFRSGRMIDNDLIPGGGRSLPDDSADEVLRTYLYYENPIPYGCDVTTLTPADRHAFTGPPDHFLRLPPIDLWPRTT